MSTADATLEAALVSRLLLFPEQLPLLNLTPEDFSNREWRSVYRAMLDLAAEHKTIDLVSLRSACPATDFRELLGEIGPAHRAPVEEYAARVRDMASRRRLIGLLEGVIARAEDGNTDSALADLSAAVAQALAGTSSDSLVSPEQAITRFVGSLDNGSAGLPWSPDKLNRYLQPAQGGELVVVAARPSVGKALSSDELVLTPLGYRPIGQLQIGSAVIGSNGYPTIVTGVYPQGEMPIYRVTTQDGSSLRVTSDHLWLTKTRNERRKVGSAGSVRTTAEIAATVLRPDGRAANHTLPVTAPVQFEPRSKNELHPYVMGVLLGDGGLTQSQVHLTTADEDIAARVKQLLPRGDTLVKSKSPYDYSIRRAHRDNGRSETGEILAELGLRGLKSPDKFVPETYLFASPDDRSELLRGLFDTDAHSIRGSAVEFTSRSERLAEAVRFLVESLGGTVTSKPSLTRVGNTYYRLYIRLPNDFMPFQCVRKALTWKMYTEREPHVRRIASVEPDGTAEAVCISIEAADGLFVANHGIVTHNTIVAEQMVDLWARESGKPILFVSLEMSLNKLLKRALVRSGELNRGVLDTTAAREVLAARRNVNVWYLDDPRATTTAIRAAAAKVKILGRGLGGIAVDYIGLVRDKGDNEVQRIARISAELKALAREHDIPVLALSQLNRNSMRRENPLPRLDDMRDSGAVEQDADIVLGLHRVIGEAETIMVVLKNRDGEAGRLIDLTFDETRVAIQ